jgi:ribosomal protein S18 acetylase RimI-like enzyme
MMTDLDAIRRGAEQPVKADATTVDAAAADLSAAFVDDPILTWFMREDARRSAARLRFFRVLLRESALADGDILRPKAGGAAAVWIPSERAGAQPLARELRALPILLNATGLARFPRLAALRGAMDKHHPTDRPHDYLWFLGVHPSAQGAGVGSRLLRARTEQLDRRGRPAFLETATPRNVPLYQRHGFRIIADYHPADGGPLIHAMWREPSPPDQAPSQT